MSQRFSLFTKNELWLMEGALSGAMLSAGAEAAKPLPAPNDSGMTWQEEAGILAALLCECCEAEDAVLYPSMQSREIQKDDTDAPKGLPGGWKS